MLRLTLFRKIFASTTFLIVLTALLVGWLSSRRMIEDARDETAHSLRSRALLLADAARPVLGRVADAETQAHIVALGHATDTRLTIIGAGGRVLADSAHAPEKMENHGDRPEILQSRVAAFGEATRLSATLGREMMYVAKRVEVQGRILGYVRATLPLVKLDDRLSRLRGVVATAAGVAILIGFVLALVVARRLTRPLLSMTEAASSIARGDYQRRLHRTPHDEIGELAGAFNEMAEQLRDRISTISRDRERLQAILSGMVEGVIALDRQERLVLINDAAARMLEVEAANAIGKHLWEVVRVGGVTDAVGTAVRERRAVRSDVRVATSGRERVLRVTAAPLAGADDEDTDAVLVLDDVTELDRLETVRQDFVANASHELKTPISAVRGLVETILDDVDMPADTRRVFLERIGHQSRRLGDLVEDMLVLSRLESAEAEMVLERIPLGEPVRDALDTVADLARGRAVGVESRVSTDPVFVRGNSDALQRVACNLLDNAVKYTPEGGKVVVRVEREGEVALLEVRDTGPGIPLAQQQRLFERFYRVDEGRSRELGGTGLGLSIVKHLVDSLGGSIEVESRPGAGTAFRVRFPLI